MSVSFTGHNVCESLFPSVVFPLIVCSTSLTHINDGFTGYRIQIDGFFFLAIEDVILMSFHLYCYQKFAVRWIIFPWIAIWPFSLLFILPSPGYVENALFMFGILKFLYVILREGFALGEAERMDRSQHASSIWELMTLGVETISLDFGITGADLDLAPVHGMSWMDENDQVLFLKKKSDPWRAQVSMRFKFELLAFTGPVTSTIPACVGVNTKVCFQNQ